MSIKSSQKYSEISTGKLRTAHNTKDLLNLSVHARGIEYCDRFLSASFMIDIHTDRRQYHAYSQSCSTIG